MRRYLSGRNQIKAANAPGIIERHHPAIARFEHDMVMFFKGFRINPHPARHAEMDNQRIAAIGLHQAIFGAPVQPGNDSPGQSLAQRLRQRPAQIGPIGNDTGEALAFPHWGQAAHHGFDFGKFGHSRDIGGVCMAAKPRLSRRCVKDRR